ncbi:MAG TPA: VCBS repeat-containing protein, partial [Gemmataceae bacterium]|nr:VCBS repeat-containing protein [Gemmataceae bacterium]
MRWKSFLRFFKRAWQVARTPIQTRRDWRHARIGFDVLETREMLSGTPPTVINVVITPPSGSASPTIQVNFSDTMVGSAGSGALNPNNYVLLGSTGTVVPITGASFVAATSPANSEVMLTYNTGNPGNALVVDAYTLYVRGNNLFDANNGVPISQPGQLFVANSGTNSLAVVNVPGSGTLGASSNYNVPFTSPTNALPRAVAFGDVNGDGYADLIVANEGTNEVDIFAGQAASAGGGFASTPTFTMALPVNTTASTVESIVLGNFTAATFSTGAPKLSIAVASGNSDTVTVFLNNSSAVGITSFAAGTSYTVGADPVGITAGDYDGDGAVDLAVLVNGTPTVDILPGTGAGTFGAVVPIAIAAITGPTSIASGVFTTGSKPTLVVGGSNGLGVLTNTSTSGAFAFTVPPLLAAGTSFTSLAVGSLSAGGALSIAAATNANSVNVFESDGSGGFAAPYTLNVAGGTGGQLAIGDLNNDG